MSDRPATPRTAGNNHQKHAQDDTPRDPAGDATGNASDGGKSDAAPRKRRRRRKPVSTLPPLRGRRIFSEQQWRAIQRALDLSKREYEILQEMFDDHDKARIADTLELSPHTIHSYLARLYQKLGVRNRASALRRVFETYLSVYPRRSGDVELLRDLFDHPNWPDGSDASKRAGFEASRAPATPNARAPKPATADDRS